MFSAKKVTEIIVADIKANLESTTVFTVKNLYGKKIENMTEWLKSATIYVAYTGCTFEPITGHTIEGNISLLFIIVDQMMATRRRERFFLDDVRDYLTWRDFTGLATEYSTDDFRVFMPTDEALFLYDEKTGRAVWTIAGTIGFDKRGISGT